MTEESNADWLGASRSQDDISPVKDNDKREIYTIFSLSYAFIRFRNSGLHLLQIDDSWGMQSNQRQESD